MQVPSACVKAVLNTSSMWQGVNKSGRTDTFTLSLRSWGKCVASDRFDAKCYYRQSLCNRFLLIRRVVLVFPCLAVVVLWGMRGTEFSSMLLLLLSGLSQAALIL